MTLQAGDRVGGYEIVEPLGAGGMGEVYRARDIKLGRDVAIKVLPEAVSRDADRVARFRREARLLASLSHANVATLYGLEESSGRLCLVMEIVEGETLAERIARGPLSVEETRKLFRQIAAGLESAHSKGILHRDLKPANLKIAADGTLRILDFGLAKMVSEGEAPGDDSLEPTWSRATVPGLILGTPAYMSPEQVKGATVDRRTDIWSFGCCLYESLAGRKAFEGESVTDVFAAIARDEPSWSELPSDAGPAIRRLLKRCLEKDPSRRIHHIVDAALELEEAHPDDETLPQRASDGRALGIAAALVSGLLLGFVIQRAFQRVEESRRVARLEMTLERGPLAVSERPSIAISPDGSHVAYVGHESETTRLYLRAIESGETRVVRGSEAADGPFFSADSLSVGFYTDGEFRRADVSGATAQMLWGGSAVSRGVWWSADDFVYVTPTNATGVVRLSTAGEGFETVSTPDPDENERNHSWPQVLPGETSILLTVVGLESESYDSASIAILDIDSARLRRVLEGGYHARITPSGHLLYMSAGNLLAAPFSLSELRVTGPGRVVVPEVMSDARTGGAQYAVSEDGTLVYVRGAPVHFAEGRLVSVGRDGAIEALLAQRRVFRSPRLSPDASRLAVAIEGASDDVWVLDIARGTLTRVTFEWRNFAPLWTPDGRELVFSSTRLGIPLLWSKSADGSGEPGRFGGFSGASFAGSWTSDGRLAFTAGSASKDIGIVSRDDESAEMLLGSRFREMAPSLSPDGRFLAFASDESGTSEIYVQPFPGSHGKIRVSTDGGTEPLWSPNGGELFFRAEEKMMVVPVGLDPALSIGTPEALFEDRYERSIVPGLVNYDVTPDGRRFVMVEPVGRPEGPRELQIVLNWFEELERLVPTETER